MSVRSDSGSTAPTASKLLARPGRRADAARCLDQPAGSAGVRRETTAHGRSSREIACSHRLAVPPLICGSRNHLRGLRHGGTNADRQDRRNGKYEMTHGPAPIGRPKDAATRTVTQNDRLRNYGRAYQQTVWSRLWQACHVRAQASIIRPSQRSDRCRGPIAVVLAGGLGDPLSGGSISSRRAGVHASTASGRSVRHRRADSTGPGRRFDIAIPTVRLDDAECRQSFGIAILKQPRFKCAR